MTFLHFINPFLVGMYKPAYKYHLYYKRIYPQNGTKCYKLIVFGHELTYFFLSSTKKEKNRYTQIWVTTNLEFRIDDMFAELGGHVCQQLVLYINTTYGYKLYPSSRRLVPLFVRCRLHKRASQQKRKEASQIF